MKPAERKPDAELPSFGISILVPLLPAILMICASVTKLFLNSKSTAYSIASFFDSAEISMLLAVLAAMFFFGYRRGQTGTQITAQMTTAIEGISNVLLVIAAGGIVNDSRH